MSNQETEAIKIAKELEALGGDNGLRTMSRAAAELRRLHEVNAELVMALKGLHDDVMDYIKLNGLGGENNHWLVIARAVIAKATGGQE